MISFQKKSAFLIICLVFSITQVQSALATNWRDTFLEGLNSYTSSGQIIFTSNGKLYNAPIRGQLPSYNVYEDRKSCVPSGMGAKNVSRVDILQTYLVVVCLLVSVAQIAMWI